MLVTRKQLKESPSGHQCRCVDFGDKVLKVYKTEVWRDKQYRNQRMLHRIDLAPEVLGDRIQVTGPDGITRFAFWSQKAETYNRAFSKDYEYGDAWYDRMERVEKALAKHGLKWYDDQIDNVGIIDGRDVLIDCEMIHWLEKLATDEDRDITDDWRNDIGDGDYSY